MRTRGPTPSASRSTSKGCRLVRRRISGAFHGPNPGSAQVQNALLTRVNRINAPHRDQIVQSLACRTESAWRTMPAFAERMRTAEAPVVQRTTRSRNRKAPGPRCRPDLFHASFREPRTSRVAYSTTRCRLAVGDALELVFAGVLEGESPSLDDRLAVRRRFPCAQCSS